MATFGAEGLLLGLGFVTDCFQSESDKKVGKTYLRRRTVALIAVIDIVLHSLRDLLE